MNAAGKILLNINNNLGTIYTQGFNSICLSEVRRALNIQILTLLLSEEGEQNMTQEQLNQLARIYNTLLVINTKGDDTLVMADCIRALKQLIEGISVEDEKVIDPEIVTDSDE